MILGTFHGIRVGLNRGPNDEWVYAFEGGRTGTGLTAEEVEAMHSTLSRLHREEGVVYEIIDGAVTAGRPLIEAAA